LGCTLVFLLVVRAWVGVAVIGFIRRVDVLCVRRCGIYFERGGDWALYAVWTSLCADVLNLLERCRLCDLPLIDRILTLEAAWCQAETSAMCHADGRSPGRSYVRDSGACTGSPTAHSGAAPSGPPDAAAPPSTPDRAATRPGIFLRARRRSRPPLDRYVRGRQVGWIAIPD